MNSRSNTPLGDGVVAKVSGRIIGLKRPRRTVRCPKCEELGLQSTIDTGVGPLTTLLSIDTYVDDDGNQHYHDPNIKKSVWRCSNGHQLLHQCYYTCPSCDYNKGLTSLEVIE